MGHVPVGPVPAEGAGAHVPRRQHREAGARDPDLTHRIGAAAEELAARLLERRGASIVARNVSVGGGEVDILAVVGGERTVVEVRSLVHGDGPLAADPVDAFSPEKAAQVRRLAGLLGVGRIDLIAVRFTNSGVDIRWVPKVA